MFLQDDGINDIFLRCSLNQKWSIFIFKQLIDLWINLLCTFYWDFAISKDRPKCGPSLLLYQLALLSSIPLHL